MRRATEADVPAIRVFLAKREVRAMFPLSNLARFGLDGDFEYAPRMWIAEAGGAVTDVLTVSKSGAVMPAMPSGDWQAARIALTGRAVSAVIGPAEECRPLIAALGLSDAPATLDRDEPQFALDLADLVIPDGPGTLHPLGAADAEAMICWRVDYEIEALGEPPEKAGPSGRDAYETYIALGSHRVLMAGSTPLATTGFNAQTDRMVQIGGVYTPPGLRRRGHARRAVALHLAEARAAGKTAATLFAASANAARAYVAVGFKPIGNWTLTLLAEPVTIDG